MCQKNNTQNIVIHIISHYKDRKDILLSKNSRRLDYDAASMQLLLATLYIYVLCLCRLLHLQLTNKLSAVCSVLFPVILTVRHRTQTNIRTQRERYKILLQLSLGVQFQLAWRLDVPLVLHICTLAQPGFTCRPMIGDLVSRLPIVIDCLL